MELRRTRMSLLMGLGAVLLAIPALGAPPAVTAPCILSGDVQSDGAVEIGVSVTAWELTDPDTDLKTTLWLEAYLLEGAILPDGTSLPAGHYYGQARILKKNGPEGGRFDFDFDTTECVSPVSGDGNPPPFGAPHNHFCRYHLTILDGVYYRGADEVVWDTTAPFSLIDYGLGAPCAVDPDNPDGCIEPGDYLVGSGTLASRTTAGFGTGGGEEPPPEPQLEPEKSEVACTDGVDNDGDGLVDDKDPNCKKWYR